MSLTSDYRTRWWPALTIFVDMLTLTQWIPERRPTCWPLTAWPMTRGCAASTRDRKNINKSPLSHEKVLISVDGNGRLRAVFDYAATGRKEFITRLLAAFGNLS